MKNYKTIGTAVALFALTSVPRHSHGQVLLTGLLQNGADSSGQSVGSPVFNTLGNELSFANIYLTQPNAGYTAPFINSGNGSTASISYALTPGTYEFYFFTMGFWNNNPGYYALNLFFNGDNTNPGIAAFSPANTLTATPIAAGLPTLSLSGDNSHPVPAPGSLVYTAAGLSVTLTGYGYGEPGVFGGPPLDRVGNLNSQPDGYLDSVGIIDLTVTAVPEPPLLQAGIGPRSLSFLSFNGTNAPDSTVDIALGQPATESSTWSSPGYGSGDAWRANDGGTNGNYTDGSVAVTFNNTNAWWQVDLGSSHNINTIKVWGRTDCCVNSNYYVFVSDNAFAYDLQSALHQSGVSSWYQSATMGSPTSLSINRTGRIAGGRYTVTDTASGPSKFYRLKR
jgi:hypothetical protein